MPRPSPRTQGVDEEGKTFQKFGTQQLHFAVGTPPKLGTPYQGVTQVDTGKNFKGLTTSIIPYPRAGIKTLFSERFQAGITGATPTPMREEALARQQEVFDAMGFPEIKFPEIKIPTWEELFPPSESEETGEDCGWFGEKCWGKDEETGEDCGWFGEKCWFKPPDLGWLKWVLLAIGLGILLWLLRPIFELIGLFKRGAV